MSCKDDRIEFTQGDTATFKVRLLTKETGEPFDLTGSVSLAFRCAKADKTALSVAVLASGSPTLGKVSVTLTGAQTATLEAREDQSFDIRVETSAAVFRTFRVVSSMSVYAPAVSLP